MQSAEKGRNRRRRIMSSLGALGRNDSNISGVQTFENYDTEIYSHTTLRGLAACAVVCYHTVLAHGDSNYFIANSLFKNSYLFVDLFFILSGYIISRSYGAMFQGDSLDGTAYRRFQLRRLIRIYPNYVVWLAIAVLTALAIEWKNTGSLILSSDFVVSLAMHVAMIQSLLDAPIKWNVPLWSIAVEVISYLVFPILVLIRQRLRGFDAVAAAFAAAGLVFLWSSTTLDSISGWPSVLRCLCGFSLGMVLASSQPVATLSAPWLSLLQLGALALAIVSVAAGAELLAVLGFVALVGATARNGGALFAVFRRPELHHIGKISFLIYLAHVPVLSVYLATAGFLERRTGLPLLTDWLVMMSFVLLGSIVAASLSFALLETRSRRWLSAKLLD